MSDIARERLCAESEGDMVVFLIGMRINKLWKVWRWLPVFFAMPRMLKELGARPELGLLAAYPYFQGRVVGVTQYWQSVAQLQAYAHAQDRAHMPAWKKFNDGIGTSGDVGIWHETYVVPRAGSESVYVNMPKYGLGAAGTLFPAKGARASAAKRLGRGKPQGAGA